MTSRLTEGRKREGGLETESLWRKKRFEIVGKQKEMQESAYSSERHNERREKKKFHTLWVMVVGDILGTIRLSRGRFKKRKTRDDFGGKVKLGLFLNRAVGKATSA